MYHRHHRFLAPFLAAGLIASGLLAAPLAPVRAAGGSVTVDTSLGNGIATGAVADPDPAHTRVTVANRYHFWAGLDLQSPTGGAHLAPTSLAQDARGIYGALGLIGPGATSAWAGTFDPSGGSQAVWVHLDLATTRGAQALALHCLTIVADTFGAPLLAPSAAVVQHAVTLITDLAAFSDLLGAVQRNDPWAIAQQWSLLLQSAPGRAAIILALADLGVIVSDGALRSLGSVAGLIDFAQTMLDLLRAGLGGHTSGLVTFSLAGPTATATAAATASPAPRPTPTPAKSIPQWLRLVGARPIVPGTGLAGVKLGDSERSVISALGDPLHGPDPVTSNTGAILFYALQYQYQSVFLGIYTTVGQRTVERIRLDDSAFNDLGYIPAIRGVTIGSTELALSTAFGLPLTTDEHFTCPASLTSNSTSTFVYQGIQFWVCHANDLVYLMDIP